MPVVALAGLDHLSLHLLCVGSYDLRVPLVLPSLVSLVSLLFLG